MAEVYCYPKIAEIHLVEGQNKLADNKCRSSKRSPAFAEE